MNFKSFLFENNLNLEQLKNSINEYISNKRFTSTHSILESILINLGDLEKLTTFEIDALKNIITLARSDCFILNLLSVNYDVLSASRDTNSIFKNLLFLTNNLNKSSTEDVMPNINYNTLKKIALDVDPYKKPLIEFLKSISNLQIINRIKINSGYTSNTIYVTLDTIEIHPNSIETYNFEIEDNTKYLLDINILDRSIKENENNIDKMKTYIFIAIANKFNKSVEFISEIVKTTTDNYEGIIIFSEPSNVDWRPNETVPEDYYAL